MGSIDGLPCLHVSFDTQSSNDWISSDDELARLDSTSIVTFCSCPRVTPGHNWIVCLFSHISWLHKMVTSTFDWITKKSRIGQQIMTNTCFEWRTQTNAVRHKTCEICVFFMVIIYIYIYNICIQVSVIDILCVHKKRNSIITIRTSYRTSFHRYSRLMTLILPMWTSAKKTES